MKELFLTTITKPLEVIVNKLSICLFLPLCFHALKGKQLEPTSVVSKYSHDRILTREFLHFDTRTCSYSSSFHKTSNEWGEF